MYENYGDENFFELGRLVQQDDSNTEFEILACDPIQDEEGAFLFAHLVVDTTDDWIDKTAVCDFAGLDEENADAIQIALSAIDYYAWENFAMDYENFHKTRDEVLRELEYYEIDSDVQFGDTVELDA